jgi:hypothetical protein
LEFWALFDGGRSVELGIDDETASSFLHSLDPCLLISSPENDQFGLIGMQTDDTQSA